MHLKTKTGTVEGRVMNGGGEERMPRGRSDMAIPGTFNLKLIYTILTEV